MNAPAYPITLKELAYREAESSYDVDLHSHTVYQMYIVLSGDVEMQIEDKSHILGPSQCIIVPPNRIRGPRCVGRAPEYLICIFEVHQLAMQSICESVLDLTDLMLRQLDALVEDLQEPDFGNADDYQVSILIQLLIDLRRRKRRGQQTQQLPRLNASARNEVIQQAESFMRANLHHLLTREQIAQAVHFSAPHLARMFKAALDKTINQRLVELRLERAKRLLLQSTMPITQIAGEVGYQSFSHFARVFQQAVSMTPSHYRSSGGRRVTRRRSK